MIATFTVPPPTMRGRAVTPAPGWEEGEQCLRLDGLNTTCLGRIAYLPDESLGGCGCPNGHPPCSYCTSTMPECTRCGWRDEE
jgi:hypothetical protein